MEKAEESKNVLIDDIVETEWKMFQEVHALDGRAVCQNNKKIFYIMRFSNYSPWPEELLRSYIHDLRRADEEKQNLVLEKYAYMMSFSDPSYYQEQLKKFLPQENVFASKMIREIVAYFLDCERQFQESYPKMSLKGRNLNSSGFDIHFASIETYARGELRSYSLKTLRLFLDFIRSKKDFDYNIVTDIRQTMVKMSGYDSLDEAEEKI